jgi:hypothetical protein
MKSAGAARGTAKSHTESAVASPESSARRPARQSLVGALHAAAGNRAVSRWVGSLRRAADPQMAAPTLSRPAHPSRANQTLRRLEQAYDRMQQLQGPGEAAVPGRAPSPPSVQSPRGGKPLPEDLLPKPERRFGADFSALRVHTDQASSRSARGLGARAFTMGDDIVFGEGVSAAHTTQGRALLAHELAHVVQQRRGGSTPSPMTRQALDREAREASDAFTGDRPVRITGAAGRYPALAPREPRSLRENLDISLLSPDQVEEEFHAIYAWLPEHPGDAPGKAELLAVLPKLEAVAASSVKKEAGPSAKTDAAHVVPQPVYRALKGTGEAAGILPAVDEFRSEQNVAPNNRETSASIGYPLEDNERKFFESHFDFNFSDVRVHTDAETARVADQLGALAWTAKNDIFFGHGRFATQTEARRAVLAHELAHVVQQRDQHTPATPLEVSQPSDHAELEADRAAAVVLAGGTAAPLSRKTPKIYRLPTSGPPNPGTTVSTVFLDANVFGEVARGNAQYAQALRAAAADPQVQLITGEGIYTELTRVTENNTVNEVAAYKAMIDKLGIKVVNVGMAGRVDTYMTYAQYEQSVQSSTNPEAFAHHGEPSLANRPGAKQEREVLKDLPHIAEAQAAGAEMWTAESKVKDTTHALGGKVASQSSINVPNVSQQSYENVLRLIPEVTISDLQRYGSMIGRTPGGTAGGGGATGGGGGAGPSPTQDLTIKEESGEAPIESFGEGGEGAGSLAAGLGTWLNQTMVHNIEESELEKAQIALGEEIDTIKQARKEGEWVGVWVVLNEPAVVDFGASIFTTPDQIKTFAVAFVTQGATAGDAQHPQVPPLPDPGGPNRVYRTHLLRLLAPPVSAQHRTSAPASQPSGPKSAAGLDADIDHRIAANQWPSVAVTLNGFNQDDIEKRVTSDPRLTEHRRQLMYGALYEMITWPPPNRVADAIYKADPDAARLGRIDYVNFCLAGARGFWDQAVLALNGFNEEDIRALLPRDIDKLRPLRKAAATAGLDRITRLIDEKRAAGFNWVD